MYSCMRRSVLAIGLVVALSTLSSAQYGGGGMGGTVTGTPGYNSNRSYGSKGAIIGAIAGGAALAASLFYWKHHTRTKLVGCVAGHGDQLVSETDNQIYSLSQPHHQILEAGERVELLGKRLKDDSGEPRFEVHTMSQDLGKCSSTTAEVR
jgi:hypothetical protein